jgi:hypothetical protein
MESGMYTDAGLSTEIGVPKRLFEKLNSDYQDIALVQVSHSVVVMIVKT